MFLFLKKSKKGYYKNLHEKSFVDNKLFRKTVKPFRSGKVPGKNKIHLIENNELVKTVLINFFSKIVQNLDISR